MRTSSSTLGKALFTAIALATAVAAVGCGDTGQPLVRVPVSVVGTAPRAQAVGTWSITLSVARVGFGPVRFCASRVAGEELCPASLAEYADSAGVDALSPAPQGIGFVDGFTGTVRSASYGFAYTWLPAQTEPRPTSHAIDGHSAHLEGTATSTADATKSFAFVADVDVVPYLRGTHAVDTTGLAAPIDQKTQRLDVTLDPSAWLAQVDFDALAATPDRPVRILPGSRAHNALVVGITSLAQARFAFVRSP